MTQPPPAIPDVVDALERMHGRERWHWDARTDPFEVAVGAVLVQHAAWTNAERALDRLRAARALAPEPLAALADADIEALIRPAGPYRAKTRTLRALLGLIAREGSLRALLALPPATLRERLLGVRGIGEETADVIVLYAAHAPAVVVDAYARRLCARLGLGPAPDAPAGVWRDWLARELPPDAPALARFHALVVLHGKRLCRARRPRCGQCELAPGCRAALAQEEAGA